MQIKPKSVTWSANQIVSKDNYVDSTAITILKHDSTLCAYSQYILWKLNWYMYHISEDCSTLKFFTFNGAWKLKRNNPLFCQTQGKLKYRYELSFLPLKKKSSSLFWMRFSDFWSSSETLVIKIYKEHVSPPCFSYDCFFICAKTALIIHEIELVFKEIYRGIVYMYSVDLISFLI